MAEGLSPCPFCGGMNIKLIEVKRLTYYRCGDCDAGGGVVFHFEIEDSSKIHKHAMDRWNCRINKYKVKEVHG